MNQMVPEVRGDHVVPLLGGLDRGGNHGALDLIRQYVSRGLHECASDLVVLRTSWRRHWGTVNWRRHWHPLTLAHHPGHTTRPNIMHLSGRLLLGEKILSDARHSRHLRSGLSLVVVSYSKGAPGGLKVGLTWLSRLEVWSSTVGRETRAPREVLLLRYRGTLEPGTRRRQHVVGIASRIRLNSKIIIIIYYLVICKKTKDLTAFPNKAILKYLSAWYIWYICHRPNGYFSRNRSGWPNSHRPNISRNEHKHLVRIDYKQATIFMIPLEHLIDLVIF